MVRILDPDGKQVIPAVHIILIEETNSWCEEIREKAGRLFGVYLFDKRRHIHACELTPSYELHFLKTISNYSGKFSNAEEEEIERDNLEMEIMDGNRETQDIQYYHVSDIDHRPTISLSKWSEKEYKISQEDYDNPDDLHSAIMDAMRDMENENESDYWKLIRKIICRERQSQKTNK